MLFLEAYKTLPKTDPLPQVTYLSGPVRYLKDKYRDLFVARAGAILERLPEGCSVVEAFGEINYPSLTDPVRVFLWSGMESLKPFKVQEQVLSLLSKPLPTGHFLLLETSDTRAVPKGPLFDKLQVGSWVECREFQEHKEELSSWVKLCMKLRGVKFPDEVVRELADIYKKDLYFLESEIEKLSRYPGPVTLEVLRNVCVGSKEASLHSLYDMLSLRNGAMSLQRISEALEVMPVRQVINGLSQFLYQMYVVSMMSRSSADTEELGEALGLNPYIVKKLRASSTRFSPYHLTVALNRLAKIDTKVRLPGDVRTLLQNLVYLLCEKPEKLASSALSEGFLT